MLILSQTRHNLLSLLISVFSRSGKLIHSHLLIIFPNPKQSPCCKRPLLKGLQADCSTLWILNWVTKDAPVLMWTVFFNVLSAVELNLASTLTVNPVAPFSLMVLAFLVPSWKGNGLTCCCTCLWIFSEGALWQAPLPPSSKLPCKLQCRGNKARFVYHREWRLCLSCKFN